MTPAPQPASTAGFAGSPHALLFGWGGLWGGLGMSLVVLYPSNEWQAIAGVLMLTQAFCVVLVGQRLQLIAGAVLPDFLTLFLAFQVVTKTIALINLLVRANGLEVGTIAMGFAHLDAYTNPYRWQAEWVFLATTVLFCLGWMALERGRPLVLRNPPPPRHLWLLYLVFSALYLGVSVFGLDKAGGALGAASALLRLCALGALAILLGGRTRYGLGRPRSWLSVLALGPFYLLALRSGMKGDFALVSLPILMPILLRVTLGRLLVLVGFLLLVVVFVFPFSTEWRKANWESWGGREQNATVGQVTERVTRRWERDGIGTTALAGTTRWLARGTSSDIGGLVMRLADTRGHLGGILIEGLAYIFVPRFLWPDKPMVRPGAWFTWYLGGARTPESAGSATATMLGTELYWMFGVSGVLLWVPLLGMLYAWCWQRLMTLGASGTVALVGLFALLVRASELEATHTIYAVAEPIVYLVYLLGLYWLQRALSQALVATRGRV